MLNLLVCCLFVCALQTTALPTCELSMLHPVTVGDNATFICTVFPVSYDAPLSMSWQYFGQPCWHLKLRQGNGTSCIVVSNALNDYTLWHTCDADNNYYTLTFVNVTEGVITQNWCCNTFGDCCRRMTRASTTTAGSPAASTTIRTKSSLTTTASSETAQGTTLVSSTQLLIVMLVYSSFSVNVY